MGRANIPDMLRSPTTVLSLLLGALLGFALAVSDGVLAERRPERRELPAQDARLLAEVIERVKAEYVDRVDDHELMQHAIRGLLSGLDAHSAFLDEEEFADLRIATQGSYSGIGIEVSHESGSIVVVAPIEGSPADRAGLRTGDVIVAVDGHEVPASGLGDAIGRMRGRVGTLVRVTVEREGVDEPIEYSIERAEVEVHSVRHSMLAPGIGYVRITHFSETTGRDLEAALAELRQRSGSGLDGLVLDLRNNPGGVLEAGVDVADAFLDSGLIVSASGRAPDARFYMEARPGDAARGARIAVLVNGGSASASEIVAAALRDHGRATLIGRRTFGKGSVQTVLPLSEGQALKLTTSRYYSPSGATIHEKGIEPDILLPRGSANPARVVARGARQPDLDEEMSVALDWLRSGTASRVAGEPAALAR